MTRRLTWTLGLGICLAIAACTGLPETSQGVTRPITYDEVDYTVDFSVQEVAETLDAPGTAATTMKFEATIIQIARADGQPMDGVDELGAIAIANAFCDSYGLTRAPVSGVATYSTSTNAWRVRNHCGSAFG